VTDSLPVTHYSAETAPRGILRHSLPAFGYPWVAWKHASLVRNFYNRELLGRFRGSLLGVLWVLIQPMFQFTVYFIVFGYLFGRVGGAPDPEFAVFLFAGIICFGLFTQGTSSALGSVVQNGNLVKKVAFPCELLPLVPVLVETIVFLVSCVVLLAFGLATGTTQLGVEFLALPWLVLVLGVFSTGLSLILANLYVFARDVKHVWGILSMAWFFMTPVFWPLSMLQQKPSLAWLATAMEFNPMFSFVTAHRQVFGIARHTPAEVPGTVVENLAIGSLWAIGAFVLGYGTFMANKKRYADLV
jgi:lipopolysaccharide transport system permease protein